MGNLLEESPGIKALGPLFKLTEVHLWDNGFGERREASDFLQAFKVSDVDYINEKSDALRINGLSSFIENMELEEQLSGLGLPLSFHTNKERNGMMSGRTRGARKKSQLLPKVIENDLLDSINVSEGSGSPSNVLDISEMLDHSEIQNLGNLVDVDISSNLPAERGNSVSSTASSCTNSNAHDSHDEISNHGFDKNFGRWSSGLSNISLGGSEASLCKDEEVVAGLGLEDGSSAIGCLINDGPLIDGIKSKREMEFVYHETPIHVDHDIEGQPNDLSNEMIQDPDATLYSKSLATTYTDIIANHAETDCGEWVTYWDDFYLRNYFYNVKTWETTWDPPVGMEHIPFVTADGTSQKLVEMVKINDDQLDGRKLDELQTICNLQPDIYSSKASRDDVGLLSQQFDESGGCWIFTDCISTISSTKKKKKVRRTKLDRKLSHSNEDHQGVLLEVTPSISKYWCQRYVLFSKFDYGIRMDEEGWFSVTPEPLAKHHAIRCGSGSIIDFFTGVGGNAIQFAQRSKHVTAIDVDPNKIDYAMHNATLYGVEDKIDFIKGDSFSLAPKLKADTVFMSPPWGGPDYTRVKKFDINTMLKPKDGLFLFNVGKVIAPKIVMFLPRNVDINQLAELSLAVTPPWSLEVEKNFLNDRLKAVTAYFCEPPILGDLEIDKLSPVL